MGEIIDYLFFFWVFVTIAVYVLGGIYEKQVRAARLKAQAEQEAKERRERQFSQDWSPSWSASSSGPAAAAALYSAADGAANRTQGTGNYNNNFSPWSYNSNRNYYNNQPHSSQLGGASPGQDWPSSSAGAANYSQTDYSRPGAGGLSSHHQYGSSVDAFASGPYNFQEPKQTSLDYQMTSAAPSDSLDDGRIRRSSRFGLSGDNSIPVATGFNSDCVDWVNQILYLFYTQTHRYGPIITESVYRSLNEKLSNITNSSPEYNNLLVEFKGINRDLSSRPELTNIRTESESEKSVSSICKIYNKRVVFNLTIERLRRPNFVGATSSSNQQQQQQQQVDDGYGVSPVGMADTAPDVVADYELILENLEGKLKSVAMLSDKLIVVQFMEKPDTKIILRQKYHSSPSGRSQINEDTLVSIILQTLTQVVVDLYFGDDPEFPQFKQPISSIYRQKLNLLKGSASELKRQIKHEFFGVLSSSQADASGAKERKVFIKILRAKNINYNQNVTCLLELDQPYQQAMSSLKQGSNPYWDEHFLFNVNEKSSELLLELWDSISVQPASKQQTNSGAPGGGEGAYPSAGATPPPTKKERSRFGMSLGGGGGGQERASSASRKWVKSEVTAAGKFLGLARISIEELRRNPVQKLNLALEPKSGDPQVGAPSSLAVSDLSNSVGGELLVELLFLEHSSSPSPASQPAAVASVGNGGGLGLHKSSSASSLAYLQKGDIVSIDRKLTPAGYVITTTTITKPTGSKRRQLAEQMAVQQLQQRNQSPVSSAATDDLLADINLDGISTAHSQRYHRPADSSLAKSTSANELSNAEAAAAEQPHRSRSRSRSRSFLRAIKKRFSFSRNRSRSVGESGGGGLRSEAGSPISMSSRNVAAGANLETSSIGSRSRSSSMGSLGQHSRDHNRAKSMPASRDPNEVPTIVINKSRHSDTGSAFTFTHPKSQLVVECTEPKLMPDGSTKQRGLLRYYAIPDNQANKGKWRKRGVKLHLFNEHQFVACHLAGSSTCHLCGRVFSRRPGKQGYKCRNCHLLSHKQCHVKVDHNCPYALKDGLKLEYIDADPPACLLRGAGSASSDNFAAGNTGSLPRQAGGGRPRGMSAKSISMEVDDR